ncbi:hypothetical protein A0H81_00033 [Grifola frondosa]|uniref:Uncharacterized protein n=1 Tax=Grifola frondosa TaxID=5627 RepID=A0A1C7MRL1_GRIFR|nr:hypothetical protein A0H81_00033 [Grifola frondosa]
MRISGSQSAISDLTKTAGWVILNCDANSTAQDIRAVCNDTSAGCEHLYQNGAAGTIVRLPQDCGVMPFARIAKEWTHENQSIPPNMQTSIRRRDGSTPVVRGIRLDTHFDEVDPSQNGNVTLFLQGSSIPGAAGNATIIAPSKRGLLDDIKSALESFASFDKNISASTPLEFSEPINLFNVSVNCTQNGLVPGFAGSVSVDLDPEIDATITYGVAVAGSLIPPSITEFGLFARLDGTLNGTLSLDSDLVGAIGTGQIPLFTAAIPGLDFPNIGPTFAINAEADATLDASLNLDVDLAYTMSGAELFFPPSTSPSGGSFVPGDSNLKLSVSPNVTSHGTVSAHLIPTVGFGLNAIDGLVTATVSLDLDASATLNLSLQASTNLNVATATNGSTASTNLTNTELDGCVDVQTGLSVNAGATGSFFSIFDASTTVSLFSTTFDLFKKCFGSTAARRAYTGRSARAALLAKRLDITCPDFSLSSLVSVIEETISGSSLI